MESPDSDSHKKMIHRIHRIQGQLAALEQAINADKPCDELVVQARAIERAVASLITFMLCRRLEEHVHDSSQVNPSAALQEIERLLKLIGH